MRARPQPWRQYRSASRGGTSELRHSRLRFDVRGIFRLLLPVFVLLLPVIAAGGNMQSPAGAAAPPPGQEVGPNRPDTLVLRVYFNDLAERDRLATELGAEEVPTTSGYLTVLADQTIYDNLVARGLRVEVDEKNTRILNNPTVWDTFYGGYKTVEEIYAFLDQKAAQYPTLAQKIDIGDSWCKEHPGTCIRPEPNNGYDLFVMRISNQAIPGPKPVFWADGGIHSREIATPEVAMRFIAWMLDNYDSDPDAHWLVDHHDIWIMPTYNPDGHHIVEAGGGGSSPYMYRKNGNNSAGNCSWPPSSFNHHGVDDNRNFPFKWGCCGGSSTLPCDQTYRGTASGGESETLAVTAKIRELIPDQRGPADTDAAPITTTGIYQNIHTVVPVNLYPWGWTQVNMPNHNEIDNIARRLSAPGEGGNNYDYGSIADYLYLVDGGSIDWAYGELGAAAISTELGGNDFLPSFTCIDNPGCGSPQGIWPENRGMLTYMAKLARTPYLLTHGPDAKLVGTNPMTVTQGTPSVLTGTINFTWNSSMGEPNYFSQPVGAAEYYIDTPPWAGGTGIPMQPVDGTFNSPTEQVTATIDTSSISPGRHTIFVRGRGQTDYQGHQTWGVFTGAFLTVQPGGGATPTATATTPPLATATATTPPATATATSPAGTATPTACTLEFTDVPSTNTFYPFVRCLACQGIINGYPCGGDFEPCDPDNNPYFRPNNYVTRGQLSKIVSQSAGFSEVVPPTQQSFEDVPPASPFWEYVERLYGRSIIGGYQCGVDPNEPCVPPDNLPYFRPNNGATRGQLTKIVSEAAGFTDVIPGTQYTFADVQPNSTFWVYVERLLLNRPGVMSGYVCGSVPSEPCDAENRPYFRPNNPLTRGQTSKIVANTFFPGCNPPLGTTR
jgi:carboxypeptidase T